MRRWVIEGRHTRHRASNEGMPAMNGSANCRTAYSWGAVIQSIPQPAYSSKQLTQTGTVPVRGTSRDMLKNCLSVSYEELFKRLPHSTTLVFSYSLALESGRETWSSFVSALWTASSSFLAGHKELGEWSAFIKVRDIHWNNLKAACIVTLNGIAPQNAIRYCPWDGWIDLLP